MARQHRQYQKIAASISCLTLLLASACNVQLYRMADENGNAGPSAQYTPYKHEHRLNPGDQLALSIWDHPELSVGSVYEPTSLDSKLGKWVEIGVTGFATLPMIGKVNLAGKTLQEAEDILTEVYSHYIESPQLALKVINMEITVTGEVEKPGIYTIDRQSIALPKLIGKAGGLTKYAKASAIQIIRGNPKNPQIIVVDLNTVDGMTATHVQLFPEDVVHVPERKGKKLDQTSQRLVPLIGLLSAVALVLSVTQ